MRLAAVSYDSGSGALVDEAFAGLVRLLRKDGLNVAGAIQWNKPVPGRCHCTMTLEDLASGRRVLTSEDRGPHARGCHLDTSAVEEAAALAAASIKPSVGLVIINRFGKQEAAGCGFRQVIEAAILLDRPVLAGVSENNRASWEVFAGDEAEYLRPSLDSVLSWCGGVLPSRPAAVNRPTHAHRLPEAEQTTQREDFVMTATSFSRSL